MCCSVSISRPVEHAELAASQVVGLAHARLAEPRALIPHRRAGGELGEEEERAAGPALALAPNREEVAHLKRKGRELF